MNQAHVLIIFTPTIVQYFFLTSLTVASHSQTSYQQQQLIPLPSIEWRV